MQAQDWMWTYNLTDWSSNGANDFINQDTNDNIKLYFPLQFEQQYGCTNMNMRDCSINSNKTMVAFQLPFWYHYDFGISFNEIRNRWSKSGTIKSDLPWSAPGY